MILVVRIHGYFRFFEKQNSSGFQVVRIVYTAVKNKQIEALLKYLWKENFFFRKYYQEFLKVNVTFSTKLPITFSIFYPSNSKKKVPPENDVSHGVSERLNKSCAKCTLRNLWWWWWVYTKIRVVKTRPGVENRGE